MNSFNNLTLKIPTLLFQMALFRKLPLRTVSRVWGWLHRQDLPWLWKLPTLHLYVWLYDCKQHEMVQPDLNKYNNLSEFFQRKLRPDTRPISNSLLVCWNVILSYS